LDQAIRRLGAGEFEGDIRVGGPADLKYLGSRLALAASAADRARTTEALVPAHVSHELKTPLTALREDRAAGRGTPGRSRRASAKIVEILRQKKRAIAAADSRPVELHRAQESVGRLELTAVDSTGSWNRCSTIIGS